MKIPTLTIYGIQVSKLNMEETIRLLTGIIEQRARPTQVITANPIMVMTALEDAAYMNVMRNAELVVPDGAGLVWAARYVGQPVQERVAGFDLVQELLRVGNDRGWKVYLIGSTAEVIGAVRDKLTRMYPGIRIVGARDGFFGGAEDESVVEAVREAQPELLLVGRSVSTQEPWIGTYKEKLNVPVMIGVGGSFDILAGKLQRAPVLFQRLGLEWFYRLLQQPSRYRRMLALPKFVVNVILNKKDIQNQQH